MTFEEWWEESYEQWGGIRQPIGSVIKKIAKDAYEFGFAVGQYTEAKKIMELTHADNNST